MRACSNYGRDSPEVLNEVPDKSPAEVQAYADMFWKKYKTVNGTVSSKTASLLLIFCLCTRLGALFIADRTRRESHPKEAVYA